MPDSLMIWVFIATYTFVAAFVMWPLILCLAISWSVAALCIGLVAEILWMILLIHIFPRRRTIHYGEMLTVGK